MRYIIGFLVTIGLIVLIVFLLLSGHGSKNVTPGVDLRDHSKDAGSKVQLIISGPIVSQEDHRELEIDVTQQNVAITFYQGYQRQIIKTQSYPNNDNAFAQFMYGLQRAGFTSGDNSASGDERGFCVAGTRDIYTYTQSDSVVFRYWSTTCKQGTYKGDIGTTVWLFKNQVPNYNDLLDSVHFNGS